jgi:hypothetical protein
MRQADFDLGPLKPASLAATASRTMASVGMCSQPPSVVDGRLVALLPVQRL